MEVYFLVKLLGAAAYAGVEYWLGKTEKVKAASVVELLVDGAKLLVKKKE